MFIYWGTRVRKSKLGYVADFCYLCRQPRAFQVERIGVASHVYGVSVGEGKLMGYNRTCLDCKSVFAAKMATYAALATSAGPVASLLEQTFPNFQTVWQARMALESQLVASPSQVPEDLRIKLIREPFLLMSPAADRICRYSHIDTQVGFAALVMVGLIALAAVVMPWLAPDDTAMGMLIAGGIGVGMVVWSLATSGARKVRRELAPVIGKSLQLIRPTPAELHRVLGELKRNGHKIGGRLAPGDVDAPALPQIAA